MDVMEAYNLEQDPEYQTAVKAHEWKPIEQLWLELGSTDTHREMALERDKYPYFWDYLKESLAIIESIRKKPLKERLGFYNRLRRNMENAADYDLAATFDFFLSETDYFRKLFISEL